MTTDVEARLHRALGTLLDDEPGFVDPTAQAVDDAMRDGRRRRRRVAATQRVGVLGVAAAVAGGFAVVGQHPLRHQQSTALSTAPGVSLLAPEPSSVHPTVSSPQPTVDRRLSRVVDSKQLTRVLGSLTRGYELLKAVRVTPYDGSAVAPLTVRGQIWMPKLQLADVTITLVEEPDNRAFAQVCPTGQWHCVVLYKNGATRAWSEPQTVGSDVEKLHVKTRLADGRYLSVVVSTSTLVTAKARVEFDVKPLTYNDILLALKKSAYVK